MKISNKKDKKSERKKGNYGLNCLYTNADQLLNKLDDLLMFIASNEPDIMMITEVIPKAQQNSISYPQLSIKGYDTYVNFNPDEENLGSSGIRGVAIYVKCNLVARKLKLNNLFSDQLWVEITLRNNDLLLCGCIYRSPTYTKILKHNPRRTFVK